jgi:hypothetical protein
MLRDDVSSSAAEKSPALYRGDSRASCDDEPTSRYVQLDDHRRRSGVRRQPPSGRRRRADFPDGLLRGDRLGFVFSVRCAARRESPETNSSSHANSDDQSWVFFHDRHHPIEMTGDRPMQTCRRADSQSDPDPLTRPEVNSIRRLPGSPGHEP